MSIFHAKKAFDEIIPTLPDDAVLAELGCWVGESTAYLSTLLKPTQTLYAIDTWMGSPGVTSMDEAIEQVKLSGATLFEIFWHNILQKGNPRVVRPVQLTTSQAAYGFQRSELEFDFVYVDADHTYDGVMDDLCCWTRLLKPRGVMLGDDYTPGSTNPLFQVHRAVQDFFGPDGFKLMDSSISGVLLWRHDKGDNL